MSYKSVQRLETCLRHRISEVDSYARHIERLSEMAMQDENRKLLQMVHDVLRRHGECSRLQLLLKLAGTVTAALTLWPLNFAVPLSLRVF